jgi:mRNA-degrading endonuclease toxin of MazEF toxin-antitoxin module
MARGDIAYINLPLSTGSRVQGGRRPAVLVIADSARANNPLVTIVPLTTTMAAARFPFTFQIDPSSQNGLAAPSIALVFQICGADRTHIDYVLGRLEDQHLARIDEMIRQLLGI